MASDNPYTVSNQMLIRKPASEVFRSLQDPGITTNFWFTKASGPLEQGATVTWHWEMYGVSAEVTVKELVPGEKIVFEWGDPKTTVEFQFIPIKQDTTYVIVKNYGFSQKGDALIEALKDNMGGFTFLLSSMKAYLEHGIQLNLVADKYPPEVAEYFNSK